MSIKLKSVLTTLDGVDEALKPAYTEKDGAFYLNVEGVAEHPEVKTLQTALTAARADKTKAEKETREVKKKYENVPDDFDPEIYHAAIDGGKDINKQLTEQRTRLTKEKETAVAKVEGERDGFKSKLQKTLSESALNNALQESNVAPEMTKAVRAMFSPQVKVEFEGDEPVVTLEGLPVGDKIKAWAATDEAKHFIKAADNGGGGARPNGGGGGKKEYDKMNLSELMALNAKGDKAAEAEMTRRNNEPIKQGVR